MDVESDESHDAIPSKIMDNLTHKWTSITSKTLQESSHISPKCKCKIGSYNSGKTSTSNKNGTDAIAGSDSDDVSSSDEPPCRKRRVCGEKIVSSRNKLNKVHWKIRSFESVLKHVRHESLKRKRALLKYRVAFHWQTTASVICPASDPVVPDNLLHRFRTFLRSHKNHPVTIFPASDDLVITNKENETNATYLQSTRHCRPSSEESKGNELKSDSYHCAQTRLGVVTKKRKIVDVIDLSIDDEYGDALETETSTSCTCPICGLSFSSRDIEEPHRSGSLKQKNKPHKSGRHRSKGEINTLAKGKVTLKLGSHKVKSQQNKNDRRYQAHQLRLKKKEEVLMRKRQIGGPTTPPFLVAVVPLGFSPVPEKLMDYLMEADTEAAVTCSQEHIFHLSVPRWKQRFSFILPAKGSLYAALDALKACDTVIFLLSAKSLSIIDEASERLLTCLLTQGLPSTSVALLDLDSLPVQKRWGYKQDVQKAISRWLPDEKVMALENNGDGLTLLRRLGSQKQRPVFQRDSRPHILAEEIDIVQEAEPDTCTVKISGYLRGQSLSVNGLVHIPGWGDFQMAQIDGPQDPHAMERNTHDTDFEVLQIADPSRQTSLISERIPDPMDAEQTWPTPEEMEDAKKIKKLVKKIPKGTSDYQACWIPEEEVDASDEGSEGDEEDEEMEADSEEETNSWEECNVVNALDAEAEPEKYDATIDASEESEMLAKMKAAREEAAFPDEVDTPRDVPARERFCKYRGLASFRTSPWDPKENLPCEYARIYQFENFARTRKRILRDLVEQIDGIPPGGYVSVHVKCVPKKLVEKRLPGEPLVLCGLLPHEHKMSVLNLVVKRSPHSSFSQLPVKSKDPVIVHCGFRRYRAKPIYSQHTNGSKHKYERFFQPETTVVATIYAPITFPPASVLLFTESGQGLLATGRVLSANPDRLIIKRVVLSGHPFKVLKRSAVIRFMFFNREDIEWFKPVELRTKYGRRGHIKEPLGTHGHMKAVFDDQLKSQDTVLMTLYKRVFPPWSYETDVPAPPPLYKVLSLVPEESNPSEDMES